MKATKLEMKMTTDESPTGSLVPSSDRGAQDTHWREFIAIAAGLVPGFGPSLRDLVKLGLEVRSGEKELHAAEWRWLLSTVQDLRESLQRLATAVEPEKRPEPADLAAVIEAAARASRKTSEWKKRRLLRNAVVNAFDPDLYAAGNSIRLLEVLADLQYGDIHLLRALAAVAVRGQQNWVHLRNPNEGAELRTELGSEWHNGDWPYHAAILMRHHLIHVRDGNDNPVESEHELWYYRDPSLQITGPGRHLLALVREPDPSADSKSE